MTSIKHKIIVSWGIFFIVELLTTFLEVWEDARSAYWLDNQCHVQTDFRVMMKKECLIANDRLKHGIVSYVINAYVSRLRWCYRYSCSELWNIAVNDTWSLIKSILLILACSTFFWKTVYKKAKAMNENRKRNNYEKFTQQQASKLIIEDLD